MVDLGPLATNSGHARPVNAAGDVAGTAYIAGSASLHAVLYRDGTMQDLGTLGGSSSFAYGVNDEGQIVGSSNVLAPDGAHAFVYRDGTMRDLNDLANAAGSGWVLSSARAINASGQIVGFGTHLGQTAAFLLTPTSNARTDVPVLDQANRVGIAAR
jgi:probable HAF family extracellular repeat protein